LAETLGRTPNAVAMKLVNFASFDPAHKQRGVKGLANASQQDKEIWLEFNTTPNKLAEQSEEAFLRLPSMPGRFQDEKFELPTGPTEAQLTRPMRLVQRFFQRVVLTSYNFACAFCGLDLPGLLNASHIIPWKDNEVLRADPRNGLCLCCLHDRAFDRGLMAVNSEYRMLLSNQLKLNANVLLHKAAFLDLKGKPINLPEKFLPHQSSLKYHLTSVFKY